MEEAQRRRIGVLCSHFNNNNNNTCSIYSRIFQIVSTSNSESSSSEKGLVEIYNSRNDCVFCLIIQGKSPAFKLYEDDVCLCILDTSPLSRGHCLLIPKLHCCSLDTTPPSVIAATCSKIPFISSAIKKATGCVREPPGTKLSYERFADIRAVLVADSFNLLVNNGAASGQVIFHTHIHIIPRKPRDRLWNSESLRRLSLELDQEASELAETIRAQLSHESSLEDCKEQGSDSGDQSKKFNDHS